MFPVYFQLGFLHISDIQAYDHILFIASISLLYSFKEIKYLALLVTAFTVGHSLSLALAAFDLVQVNKELIEFLIPVTILITALSNLFAFKTKSIRFKLFAIVFFGLIHGLGFSNFLIAVLNEQENISLPLIAFNLGLEVGQLLILLGVLFLNYIAIHLVKVNKSIWHSLVSVLIALVAIYLMYQTKFW